MGTHLSRLSKYMLALLLVLAMAACGGEDGDGTAAPDDGADDGQEGTGAEEEPEPEPDADDDDAGEEDDSGDDSGDDAVAEFYSENPLTIRIGFPEGGGYDTMGRLVSRHLDKHIPGNPDILIENHPGGGSMANANEMAVRAPSDGSVIGSNFDVLLHSELLEREGVQFSFRDFRWIGGVSNSTYALIARSDVAESLEDAMEEPITVGATGPGTSTHGVPTILNSVVGTQFEIVTGYEGTAEIALALERGEVDAYGVGTDSLFTRHGDWLEEGFVNILVAVGPEKDPRYSDDVPLVYDYIEDEDEAAVMDLFVAPGQLGYPFNAPPGTPDEFVEALREAFVDTMEDPEFQAEAESMDVIPGVYITGEEIDQVIEEVFDTPPEILELFREYMAFEE